MKLTIIPSDGTVVKDGVAYTNLNLSGVNVPSDVHALQWHGSDGWVEQTDMINVPISSLPDWAEGALLIWQMADDEANAPTPDPTPEELTIIRIEELKGLLRESDYVALTDYDKEKPDVLAQRAAWRAEIRELEASLS